MKQELLSVNEAAELLKLKASTIRKWVLLRKIASVRVGGRAVRIPAAELDRMITTVPAREVRQ